MHKVIFSLQAEEDMFAIHDFIAEDNPLYANKVVESLFASCMQLAYFPAMGTLLSDNVRMIVEPTFRYTIIYKFEKEAVQISTISKYRNIL